MGGGEGRVHCYNVHIFLLWICLFSTSYEPLKSSRCKCLIHFVLGICILLFLFLSAMPGTHEACDKCLNGTNEVTVLSLCMFYLLIQIGLFPSNLDNQIDLIVFVLSGPTESLTNW